MQPINDRVIIRRIDLPVIDEKQYPTLAKLGVVPAGQEKEMLHGQMIEYENLSHKGEVVAVGPGKWVECKRCHGTSRRPMSVKPGDVIYFGRFADFDRDGLLVIQEDDILGVEEPAFA